MDDFAKVLAAAGLDVSRRDLDHGYEASGAYLGRVWSDDRDVPVQRHVATILAAADPELPRRVTIPVMAELVDAYARPVLLVPPAVDPGARAALETLTARGYSIVLVSNTMRTPGATLRTLLERYGLLGFFTHTTFSDEIGIRKPAPEIFALALRAVGGDAATAVHVGDDARLDVEGARAAGMRVIQMRSTSDGPPAGQTPDAVITSMHELPAAVDRMGGRLIDMGAPMAPNPPPLGAPRHSRGARSIDMGAPTWPPTPHRSGRPGKAAAPLDRPLADGF